MSHWWKLIVPLGLAFAITGFGGPAASGGTPPGPDEPSVSSTSPPRDVDSTPPPLVTPRPGMAGVRPVPWDRAEPVTGGRALLVSWWSGVEPCQVLDRVEVQERAPEVVVTLYEGHDPAQPDVECIDIAMEKTTLVKLDTSLGARKIVDGSR
ncbi:MAG TPA: hypothetical protein VGO16_16905 [Pseudonocardiaceae bacterium]|jgi:hypothetical protein|nr:hypothetical protein [Pseudonocardiaceae bacterium]